MYFVALFCFTEPCRKRQRCMEKEELIKHRDTTIKLKDFTVKMAESNAESAFLKQQANSNQVAT